MTMIPITMQTPRQPDNLYHTLCAEHAAKAYIRETQDALDACTADGRGDGVRASLPLRERALALYHAAVVYTCMAQIGWHRVAEQATAPDVHHPRTVCPACTLDGPDYPGMLHVPCAYTGAPHLICGDTTTDLLHQTLVWGNGAKTLEEKKY